jgi:hypothetical protein
VTTIEVEGLEARWLRLVQQWPIWCQLRIRPYKLYGEKFATSCRLALWAGALWATDHECCPRRSYVVPGFTFALAYEAVAAHYTFELNSLIFSFSAKLPRKANIDRRKTVTRVPDWMHCQSCRHALACTGRALTLCWKSLASVCGELGCSNVRVCARDQCRSCTVDYGSTTVWDGCYLLKM